MVEADTDISCDSSASSTKIKKTGENTKPGLKTCNNDNESTQYSSDEGFSNDYINMDNKSSHREVIIVSDRQESVEEQGSCKLQRTIQFCKKSNILTSIFDFVIFKKPRSYPKPGIANFLCIHNKCMQLTMDRCPSPLTCFHKDFTLPTSDKWVTREFMSVVFHLNEEAEDITGADGKASLEFRWNRAITFESTCYPITSRGYAGYKSGTL